MIDLRSDTLTLPSEDMKKVMFSAPLGDDVFVEDPTVIELEKKGAALFNKEAALFCPSGTMTNQIAINIHTQPGDELICSRESHVYNYEGGGIAKNSGASMRLIEGSSGLIDYKDVISNINIDDVHYPITSLVVLENTSNRGGGVCYHFSEMEKISKVCRENNLKLHLDGARVFNAIIRNKENPISYGEIFDSISVCLSKGLGAPIGSLLIGNKSFIQKARRVRKVLGGGMRQVGVIAAAGIYALEHNINRLANDHRRAESIEKAANKCSWVDHVIKTETNIIVINLKTTYTNDEFVSKLKKEGILCISFGVGRVRMVTHLDIDDNDVKYIVEKLNF
jgi:threonine aldolase